MTNDLPAPGYNLPYGVSNSDPHLSGVWPMEGVLDECYDNLKKARRLIEGVVVDLEDQMSANELGSLPDETDDLFQQADVLLEALMSELETVIPEDPRL